ncbi:MAG: tryptophan--tRNA ligase [Candidatus Nanoarchaeia archaeon]|nr:tryptophan--tRNA ligase [Candidatus Nanoarchaeia archaeon]MDD5054143.1 tryptophan--tRNA ligase [Candidatus Nanoarchaeia archaeon]MDD5499256.1 tryptophan--tRNA ligase [Candidatus Nanoarchaeia archaeon]
MKVDPWNVSGDIDYEKLIKEFGTEKIDKKLLERIKKHTGELHYFLKRGIFFSHRDMNWVLDEYEKGSKFYLYTGRSPSGDMTLGHLIPLIFTKWLQDKFGAELLFQFPDEEKFLFKDNLTFKDTEHYLHENMLDVIALGFNPKKTKFLIDTKHATAMYKPACMIAKKITFSTAKAVFGFDNSNNLGQIFYTAMQSVPAMLPSYLKGKNIPCLIPYAIDQDPHFRITRDVLPKLGYYKPAAIHSVFLPPLTGPGGKMSASDKLSAIYLTDDEKTVKKKIMKYAFSGGKPSIEEHRKLGGNPDIDVSYQWLRFFEEDDGKLKKHYNDYKNGKLLTGELKQILIDKLNKMLKEHQIKRKKAESKINEFIYRA